MLITITNLSHEVRSANVRYYHDMAHCFYHVYGFKNCLKIPSSKIYGINSIMDKVRKLFTMIENRNYYFLQYDDLNIQIDKSYTFSIILNGVMNFNNHYFLSWRITDIVL